MPVGGSRRAVEADLRQVMAMTGSELADAIDRYLRITGELVHREELEAALLRGEAPDIWRLRWAGQAEALVADTLGPTWDDTIARSGSFTGRALPRLAAGELFRFDPGAAAVLNWTRSRGARLVVELPAETLRAIQGALARAVIPQGWTVDEVARVIRPMIGLHERFARAVDTYRASLLEAEVAPARAVRLSRQYAESLRRHRATVIARNELVEAYAEGRRETMEQARAAGYIGATVGVWMTADDERVCPICLPLDGVRQGGDGQYDGQYARPPAHVLCRCVEIYEEIAP